MPVTFDIGILEISISETGPVDVIMYEVSSAAAALIMLSDRGDYAC
jgi:hypothetical protein